MAFLEIQFPTDISYGSRGGPRWNTSIIELDSGAEERIQRWDTPRWVFDVSYGIKRLSQLDSVRNFYLNTRGATYGFRYKDWHDFSTASDNRAGGVDKEDVSIGTGDSVSVSFQLVKRYVYGAYSFSRPITKPVEGTVEIALNGVAQTESTHFTVDYTTGIVTFVVAPSASVDITAGFEFDVPVRFGTEVDLDGLQSAIDHFDSGGVDSIPLLEDKEGQPVAGQWWFGGAKDHGTTTGIISVGANDPRVHTFAPASALEVRLPELTYLAQGGPHFVLLNSGAGTITVRDFDDSATVATLAGAGTSTTLHVGISGGSKVWVSA